MSADTNFAIGLGEGHNWTVECRGYTSVASGASLGTGNPGGDSATSLFGGLLGRARDCAPTLGFMGDQFEAIDDKLAAWMTSQPMFFVSTAPLDPQGLVNCSPKGLAGTFAVLGPLQVAYLDLTGSGIETIAHLRENGRMVIMFCAFDGRPRIVRLHGRGNVLLPGEPSFVELADRFSRHEGVRSIIVLDVARLADSCGYAVPRMTYEADRDVLDLDHHKRGAQGLAEFRAEWNAMSLDGLPGLD